MRMDEARIEETAAKPISHRRNPRYRRGPVHAGQASSGFTLLEVVISLLILASLTISVATMLRAGFEVERGLGQKAKVMHRLSNAMAHLSDDIQHTFFVSTKNQDKNGISRRTKAIFKIDDGRHGDKLQVTTKTHKPLMEGTHQSDLTYVVYELREAEDASGRTHLYRGDYGVIPENFREEPPMRILARNIKTMKIQPWNGRNWSDNGWDTKRREMRNKLPHMVKITIEAWVEDRTDGDGRDESADKQTETLSTAVYLVEGQRFKEIKEGSSTIRWGSLGSD